MPVDFLILALVTMVVVVDPLGLMPTLVAITHSLPDRARRVLALRACLIAAAILVGSALIRDWLLRMLSICLPAFHIAGGLLLFSVASEMVFGLRIVRQTKQAEEAIEEHVRNIAAFPLSITLMAGPARSPQRCCSRAALAVQFVIDGVRIAFGSCWAALSLRSWIGW